MTTKRPWLTSARLASSCFLLAIMPTGGCGDDIVEANDEVAETSDSSSSDTTSSDTTSTTDTETSSSTDTTSSDTTSTSETSGTETSSSTESSGSETTTTTDTTSEGGGVCGDGTLDPGEDCDDGNMVDDDACNNACALNPFLIEIGDPALDLAIPDGIYLGTLASMGCGSFEVQDDATVLDVEVTTLAITHTFIGELTAKVVSPSGTVITLFSRPGLVDQADDGSSCCGESANLDAAGPLSFADDFMADPESMGGPLGNNGVACVDDGICEYHTNPGSAAPGTLIDFVGEGTAGFWQVCVGDSVNGDTGTLVSVGLAILAG